MSQYDSNPAAPTAWPPLALRDFALEAGGRSAATTTEGVPATPAGAAEVELSLALGRTRIGRSDIDALHAGSVVPLDEGTNDPVDVLVDGRVVARGEAVVLDNQIAVRITQILEN